ncbi:MAG TPA: hypothetical protein VHZ73_08645 [Vicinamibacterales bacterium]|jgi:hypothetical protein|nr:hypothetical protein [Vicinamibacterales bacterium]
MRPHHFVISVVTSAALAAFQLPAHAQQPAQNVPQPNNYLDQAGGMLKTVPNNVSHEAAKPLDELRKHFDELNKAYRAQKDQIGPALSRQDPDKDIPTWRDNFSEVERDLVVLIGGGSSLAPSKVNGSEVVAPNPTASEPGAPGSVIAGPNPSPVGTTGTTPPTVASPTTSATTATPTTTTGVPSAAAGTTTTSTIPNADAPGVATPTTVPAPISAPSAASGAAPTPSPTAPGSATAVTGGDTLTMANGLAASKVSVTGLKDLDPSVRLQLEKFRLQLELFYSATMGPLN